ncbi:hypothetical protein BGE01nite_11420 [Brevifollis gellanilyticus]|uniref:Uncharacterized protein n=1 Tax=Brevifollis gellanilyticus TaxID=748831 RepID=A0A512M681_9BACT|nr:hypothetical protein BGE01nite_11420 [Brevifollis gellanilyticus]
MVKHCAACEDWRVKTSHAMNHSSFTKAAPPNRALITPATWAIILTIAYLLLAMCGQLRA